MKCDYKHAKEDIDKAMKYKLDNPKLADEYYQRSIIDLNKINDLHDDIVDIINNYRKTNGEPPEVMKIIWDYEHDNMIEGIAEIKQLQDYYESM